MGRVLDELVAALLTQEALFARVDVSIFNRVFGLTGGAFRHRQKQIASVSSEQIHHYYLGSTSCLMSVDGTIVHHEII